MAQQEVERPRQAGRRRLVPGEQQRHQLVADLGVVHRLAVLEPRLDQQRQDVLARIGAARGDLRAEHRVDLLPQRLQLRERVGPAEAAREQHAELQARRRRAGQQLARGARPAARGRAASVTPNTARRITSSVTACIRGCSANGSPAGQLSTSRATTSRTVASYARMRAPWNGGSISLRRARCSRPSSSSSEREPMIGCSAIVRPGRQRVPGDGVERADRLRVGEHHHRRLEAEEADAERVAEAAAARLQERDRPQQPAQGLHDRRLGRPWRQRAHRAYCRIDAHRPAPIRSPAPHRPPPPGRAAPPAGRGARAAASSTRSATARRPGSCGVPTQSRPSAPAAERARRR